MEFILTGTKKTSTGLAMASNNVLAVGRLKGTGKARVIEMPVVEVAPIVDTVVEDFILPSWLDAHNAKVYNKASRR